MLVDETHPELPFKEGYVDWLEQWKHSHNPSLWMKNSCVWYSQVLVPKLGMTKFKEYITRYDYGNHDVSGDKGKDNGLTASWLSSSLQISPEEQVSFLQKLVDNKFPVSLLSHEMTKKIIFVDDLPNGWKLYGKTGAGLPNPDGTIDENRQMGWFVGWIEKDKRRIVFASYIEQDKQDLPASWRARDIAKEKLLKLVQVKK